LGVAGFTNGATTFKYWGQKATATYNGIALPSGGWIAPNVDVDIIHWPSPTGTGNMNASGSFNPGDLVKTTNSTGTAIVDAGNPAGAPATLQYLGTGADGAESVTSGTAALAGEYYYTSFNVSSGATVTVASYLVIHSTGACTINGNILANGTAFTLGNTNGVGGGSSGGSGGGTAAGTTGKYSYLTAVLSGPSNSNPGTAGAASGGNGGNGLTPSPSVTRLITISGLGNDWFELSGAGSVAGANSGGAAVKGAGGVVLICASITGTGTIDVSGAAGNPPTANSEGASSGSGGAGAILSSQAPETFSIAIDAGGGAGGQVSVPYAVPNGTTSIPSGLPSGAGIPVLTLGVSGGALSSCTVTTPGSGLGSSPSLNFVILGGGGTGGTITPTYSSGAVASCTASGGSGYTAAAYTTAGNGGYGGSGWSAEFQGW
jgi:hypothetical protein